VSSQSNEPKWIREDVVLAIHERQLAEHGGSGGTRDAGLLSSALARPRNAAAYGDPDIPELASLYALGVIKNHPFIDGNKRVGAVLLELFLGENGYSLPAEDEELLAAILGIASGKTSDAALTAWVQEKGATRPLALPLPHAKLYHSRDQR
jgi:death on curing protein